MSLDRSDVEDLVHDSCTLLDAKDWKGFLGLCDQGFRYKVTAFAPEIAKDMTWLDRDRTEIEEFVGMLPKHNTDPNPLTRHAQVTKVRMNGVSAEVVSNVQIYWTALNGGATRLFAIGKYYDTVSIEGERPKLLARHVKLDTRDLGWGTHVPL